MPSNPGDPSHGNTSSLGSWKSLAALMVQVQNIMNRLDDASQHLLFNDGTMQSFVRQLNRIKDEIPSCTPHGQNSKTKPIAACLRKGCQHLNLAAVAYRKKNCQNTAFYNCMEQGRKELDKVLEIWQRILEGW